MINAFTVDLEYWWNNEYFNEYKFEKNDDLLIESTKKLLDLLDENKVSATFFVLGQVAEKYPDLIELISNEGHEIASHGYSHKMLYQMDKNEFENEIKKSIKILTKITHEKPRGFRAPCFSINNDTKWALDILEKYNFKYDSSIFPIKTKLYGMPKAPPEFYKPSKTDLSTIDSNGKISEFPLTVIKILGKNIPLAGGFYLRTMPLRLLNAGLKHVSKTRPIVLYIHPREIDLNTPVLPLSWKSKFIVYNGVNSTLKKLKVLIKNFKFTSIEEVLTENIIQNTNIFSSEPSISEELVGSSK
jgi:polysaccharide deacetylase family protein (PEP-CTERM system associated)